MRKKPNKSVYTECFNTYDIKEQAKLICDNRNENSRYLPGKWIPWQSREETLQGDGKFHVLIWVQSHVCIHLLKLINYT